MSVNEQSGRSRRAPRQAGRVRHALDRPWLGVGSVLFAVAWGGNEFTPLLVMYQLHSGFSTLAVNVLFGGYVLGIIPALLIGGPIADRIGRRPVAIPAPLCAMAGSVVLALGAENLVTLFIGRLLSGIALGIAMAVATTWIKELSTEPYDTPADPGTGARRASITLSVGFGVGAGFAGALAQWAPLPTLLPYLLNVVVLVPATIWMLRRSPETQKRAVLSTSTHHGRTRFALLAEEGIDPRVRRRFFWVVAPAAPWVFGCAGSAYAILPTQLREQATGIEIAFSALMCVTGLTFGVGIQPAIKRWQRPDSSATLVAGLAVAALGMLLAATALSLDTLWAGLIAAAFLGTGYGTILVSGLQYVQRIAPPGRLAAFTAVFYSLTYLGFFMPAVLSAIALAAPGVRHPAMFLFGAIAAVASGIFVATANRLLNRRARRAAGDDARKPDISEIPANRGIALPHDVHRDAAGRPPRAGRPDTGLGDAMEASPPGR